MGLCTRHVCIARPTRRAPDHSNGRSAARPAHTFAVRPSDSVFRLLRRCSDCIPVHSPDPADRPTPQGTFPRQNSPNSHSGYARSVALAADRGRRWSRPDTDPGTYRCRRTRPPSRPCPVGIPRASSTTDTRGLRIRCTGFRQRIVDRRRCMGFRTRPVDIDRRSRQPRSSRARVRSIRCSQRRLPRRVGRRHLRNGAHEAGTRLHIDRRRCRRCMALGRRPPIARVRRVRRFACRCPSIAARWGRSVGHHAPHPGPQRPWRNRPRVRNKVKSTIACRLAYLFWGSTSPERSPCPRRLPTADCWQDCIRRVHP